MSNRLVPVLAVLLTGLAACTALDATSPHPRQSAFDPTALLAAATSGTVVAPTFSNACGDTFMASNALPSPVAYYWRATGSPIVGYALAQASRPVYFSGTSAGRANGVTVFADPGRTLPFGTVTPSAGDCIDGSTAPVRAASIALSHVCENTWRVANSNSVVLILEWSGSSSGVLGAPAAAGSGASELYFDAGVSKQVVIRHRGKVIARESAPKRRPACTGPAFPNTVTQVVAGDGQSIVVGDTVPTPPRVRVTTTLGQPVQGASITFSIGSGYGFIQGTTGVTDASGEFALGQWELSEPGSHTVTARTAGVPSSSLAQANATARNLAWTPRTTPGENISSVWGTTPQSLFSSGGFRTLNYWNGTSWSAMAHPAGSANRYSVHGRSLTDVYSAGQWGVIHYDGSTWATSLQTSVEMIGVWVAPDGQAFAVGDGTFYRFNGSTWIKEFTGLSEAFNFERLQTVWGTSSNNVYAVGRRGIVLRWNGTSIQRINTGYTEDASTVFGFGPNEVFVTDVSGVLRFDGTGWSKMTVGSGVYPVGLWGTSSRNLYLSSLAGDVWRYDGRAWSRVASLGAPAFGMFGLSPANVYVGMGTSPGIVYFGQ